MTLAGSTLGIDSTAIVHVAGISADGAIVIPAGNSYGWNDGCFITTASGALRFAANSGYYGVQLANSIFSVYRDAFFEDGVHVAGAAGISADKGIKLGGGITFPGSTHQVSIQPPWFMSLVSLLMVVLLLMVLCMELDSMVLTTLPLV
jgi:hypothetical protein